MHRRHRRRKKVKEVLDLYVHSARSRGCAVARTALRCLDKGERPRCMTRGVTLAALRPGRSDCCVVMLLDPIVTICGDVTYSNWPMMLPWGKYSHTKYLAGWKQ